MLVACNACAKEITNITINKFNEVNIGDKYNKYTIDKVVGNKLSEISTIKVDRGRLKLRNSNNHKIINKTSKHHFYSYLEPLLALWESSLIVGP